MTRIHPTAVIDPSAQIGENVTIGAYTIVEASVQVGDGCRIGAHVTLGERLRLGARVTVHNYACLGTASQDMKHKDEISWAQIGDDAVVREFVTVNRGSREGSVTRVGARALLLAYSHVAHECEVGDGAILVNAANLGGEVTVGRGAIVGGLTGVHQFCRVGDYAIVGACSKVTQDIAPYLLADGHPARPYGPNRLGLRRNGFGEATILQIERIYRRLFGCNRTLEEGLAEIEEQFGSSSIVENIIHFCRASQRGLARPRHRARVTSDAINGGMDSLIAFP